MATLIKTFSSLLKTYDQLKIGCLIYWFDQGKFDLPTPQSNWLICNHTSREQVNFSLKMSVWKLLEVLQFLISFIPIKTTTCFFPCYVIQMFLFWLFSTFEVEIIFFIIFEKWLKDLQCKCVLRKWGRIQSDLSAQTRTTPILQGIVLTFFFDLK